MTDESSNWGSSYIPPQELMRRYSSAVAYVAIKNHEGDQNIGSAFHIGNGVLVTARHVIFEKEILEIGHSDSCANLQEVWYSPELNKGSIHGPYYHPDANIDVALIQVDGLDKTSIPLGFHLDDWLDNSLILSDAIVMGYPPIPFAKGPLLVTTKAEINTIVDLRGNNPHPRFVLSSLARGGFSGGPAISCYDFSLGVITDSLSYGETATELGYLTALTVEPILDTIGFHNLSVPDTYASWVLYGSENPWTDEASD